MDEVKRFETKNPYATRSQEFLLTDTGQLAIGLTNLAIAFEISQLSKILKNLFESRVDEKIEEKFDGVISELKLFDRVLSNDEIDRIAKGGIVRRLLERLKIGRAKHE